MTIVALEPSIARAGRRWAPYAREVQAAPRNVYLFTGADAWARARARREARGPGSTLLLPAGDEPGLYRWPIVPGGILIVAITIPRSLALDLARCIVSDGSPIAFVIAERDGFSVASSAWRRLDA
jgi:hypothetical protein